MNIKTEPYDILAIPYFPWTPGPKVWLIPFFLAVFLTVLALLRYSRIKRRKQQKAETDLSDTLTALRRLNQSVRLDNEEIFSASRRLRSMLSISFSLDCSAKSIEELRSIDAEDLNARDLLNLLISFEELKYKEKFELDEVKEMSDRGIAILLSLEERSSTHD